MAAFAPMNRTKIICTMGPSVASEEKITELAESGMSVIRFNCSHGTPATRRHQLAMVRRVEKRLSRSIGVMVDLQGPKMRVGDLPGPFQLNPKEVWQLSQNGEASEDKKIIPLSFSLSPGVAVGGSIYMNDGLIWGEVVKKDPRTVWIRVIHGGIIESRKGINIPFYRGKIDALSSKDRADVDWALHHRADFIALSFVRHAEDIEKLKTIIAKKRSDYRPLVIAKIEKPEAVDEMDDIIRVSDGILVARGDLGIELKPEKVPVVQKQLIERCRYFKKPVIVATQMLDSMRVNPVPTRAEVSDVASAIYAGADAVLLTGETSNGLYPIEATDMMNRIIGEVENHMIVKTFRKKPEDFGLGSYEESFIFNVMQTADDIDAKAIVILNRRGVLTKILSKLHPKQPVYSMALTRTAYRQLSLYWGVFPAEVPNRNTNKRIESVLSLFKARKLVRKSDKLIFVYRDYLVDNLNLKIVEIW